MPEPIQFVTGQFLEFRVVRGFHFGALSKDFLIDEILEFDGRTLKIGGEKWDAPSLKNAIKVGVIVLASAQEYEAPVAKSAGVQVRPADSARGGASVTMSTVAEEERLVSTRQNFQDKREAVDPRKVAQAQKLLAAHARSGDTDAEVLGLKPPATPKYAVQAQEADEVRVRRLSPATPKARAQAEADARAGRTRAPDETPVYAQDVGVSVRTLSPLPNASRVAPVTVESMADVQRGMREAADRAVAGAQRTQRHELTPEEYRRVLADQKAREAAYDGAVSQGYSPEQAKGLLAQQAREGASLGQTAVSQLPVLTDAYWQALMNMAFQKCAANPSDLQKAMAVIMEWRGLNAANPDLDVAWGEIEDILHPPAYVPDAAYWQGLMSKAFNECAGDPAKLQKAMGLIMQWQKIGQADSPDVDAAWDILSLSIIDPEIPELDDEEDAPASDTASNLPGDGTAPTTWDMTLHWQKRIKLALEQHNTIKGLTAIIALDESKAVKDALQARLQELLGGDIINKPIQM